MKVLDNFSGRFQKIGKVYLLIILVSIFLIFPFLIFIPNDLDNARYILSSIIQSLAAILAIVISLTLVAVQLFSQNYSPRILKKIIDYSNYYFWGLIVLYSISIIFTSIILNYISNEPNAVINLFYVNLSIYLMVLCLLFLFPYIRETIKQLQPEEVISAAAEKINKDYINELTKYNRKKFHTNDFTNHNKIPSNEDVLTPLTDIIIGAIKNGDSETVDIGLRELGNSILRLINNNIINDRNDHDNESNSTYIFRHLLDYHIQRIKHFAIINGDYISIGLIISILDKIGTRITDKDPNSYNLKLLFLGDLSEKIVEIEFESEIWKLVAILKSLVLKFNDEQIKKARFVNVSWNTFPKENIRYMINDEFIQQVNFPNVPWHLHSMTTITYLNNMWVKSIEKSELGEESNLNFTLSHIITDFAKKGLTGQIIRENYFLLSFGIYLLENDPPRIDNVIFLLNLPHNILLKKLVVLYKSQQNKQKIKRYNETIIDIIDNLKFIGYESIKMDKQDFKISQYYQVTELILIEDTIILKIINIQKDIALSHLTHNYSENKQLKIVSRIADHMIFFSIELAKKRSYSVSKSLEHIYLILKHLLNSSFTSKEDKVITILDKFEKIGFELTKSELNEINDYMFYLKEITVFDNICENSKIKKRTTECLAEIGLKLTEKESLNSYLIKLTDHLTEITIKNIELDSDNDADFSLSKLESIAEKMVKMNVKTSNIDYTLDKIQYIRNKLVERNKEDIVEKIDRWNRKLTTVYTRDI